MLQCIFLGAISFMVTPFPKTAWNVNVVASGSPSSYSGRTMSVVGTLPPQTGMPVFYTNYPVSPQRYIQRVDLYTGLVTVGVSGATGQQLWSRSHPWEVNIWLHDAYTYAWPTGTYHTKLANVAFTPPTGVVRGTDLTAGGGFIRG